MAKTVQKITTTQRRISDANKMSDSFVENASWLFAVATIGLGTLAAVAGAIGWYFSSVESKIKDRRFSQYQMESNARIAEAQAKGESASQAAAEATKLAAALQLKSEEMASTNLLLRAEVAKLEAAVRWRTIDSEQESILVGMLSPVARELASTFRMVEISTGDLGAETVNFAKRIAEVLSACGFEVAFKGAGHASGFNPDQGVVFLMADRQNPPPHSDPIIRAFEAAKIQRLSFASSPLAIGETLIVMVLRKPDN